MGRTIAVLAVSGFLGVVLSSLLACGASLLAAVEGQCGFGLRLVLGGPVGVLCGLILGFPLDLLYERLGWRRWWQYVIGGAIAALPLWFQLAVPGSDRFAQLGWIDTLVYVGAGAFGALVFWWLKASKRAVARAA